MNYKQDLANLYYQILEEGIEEKIPKLLNLVRPDIENKEEYIRWAANTFDPTSNATYITWILRMLKRGVIVGEEDSEKVKERLTQFEKLKLNPQFPKDKKDINSYKTYGDLVEILDQFSGIKTKGEIRRGALEEGIQFVGEVGHTVLYIVSTEEAGAKYFRETEWCVRDPKYFNNYGPPYYFFTKNGQPHTLLHLNSSQCMDVRDRPVNLNAFEKDLMSSEEMTDYVLKHDNSDKALAFYSEKVGEGHDGRIHAIFWGQMESLIQRANQTLKMFTIIEPNDVEDLESYQPEAWGSISYDLTPYENHVGDKEFLKTIENILRYFDIYLDSDFIYGESISEDLQTIQITLRYEDNSYNRDSITGKLESFIDELEKIENNFDPESFDEKFKETMLEKGYLSSGWGNFIGKVSVDNLKFKNFKKSSYKSIYLTPTIIVGKEPYPYAPSFDIVDVDKLLLKHKRQDHPYVLLGEFLKPFIQRGLELTINKGANTLVFSYSPKYKTNNTGKQYIRGLKAVKDFDTHFEFYITQIKNFMNNYVFPFLHNYENGLVDNSYGIPTDIKLPLLQIKSRKDSEEQGMLDLHEKRTFDKFYKDFLFRDGKYT